MYLVFFMFKLCLIKMFICNEAVVLINHFISGLFNSDRPFGIIQILDVRAGPVPDVPFSMLTNTVHRFVDEPVVLTLSMDKKNKRRDYPLTSNEPVTTADQSRAVIQCVTGHKQLWACLDVAVIGSLDGLYFVFLHRESASTNWLFGITWCVFWGEQIQQRDAGDVLWQNSSKSIEFFLW